jgi:hypothetical protein
MAMTEAGVHAAKSFRDELLKNDTETNAEGIDINIDVSTIMHNPTTASARKKKRAVQVAPGFPLLPPGVNLLPMPLLPPILRGGRRRQIRR